FLGGAMTPVSRIVGAFAGDEAFFGFFRILRTFSASRWCHGGSRLDFLRHGSDVRVSRRSCRLSHFKR
ncbi:MAG: hypothetical protein ACRD6B_20335, partial [Bryobacteraceae bacterium]